MDQTTTHVYKKASGCAGSKGVDFQIDLLSLFVLNSLRHNIKAWKLSTEDKLAGKFDDVVLELADGSAILLQAKYKDNKKITLDQLLSANSKNEDFGLPKYFFSYLDVKTKFSPKFIIVCTNTKTEAKIFKFVNQNDISRESMLRCQDGGLFFTFNNDLLSGLLRNVKLYHKNNLIGKNLDESLITEDNAKEFLKHLQFYVDYPSGNDLKQSIEKILSTLKTSNALLNDISYRDLRHKVKEWFEQPKGEYLTEDRVMSMFCEIKSEKHREWLENFKVFFKENDLDITDSEKRIFHVITKNGYLLHLLQVYRKFQDTKSKILYVDYNYSEDEQIQMIRSFELPLYSILIIVSSKFSQECVNDEVFHILRDILKSRDYKKVVFIAEHNDKFVQRMISTTDDHCVFDKPITLEGLSEDTQEMLLTKKSIVFQGENVSLQQLFPEPIPDDVKTSITSEILEKILTSQKITIGKKLDDLNEDISRYYIDRRFQKISKQSEDNQEIIFEEDIGGVLEKMVLISDSAGTGKTTVLTHMATEIKKYNPRLWVIRIELNECTRILRDALKNNRSLEVTDLLECMAKNDLERIVFSLKGMVVLLFDGVDEISPDYTQLLVSLLIQSFRASNVVKMFVTTRPHVTSELEKELYVSLFTLVPFTKRNQVDFLTNYWTYNLNQDNSYYCREYAKALVNKVSSWMLVNWYINKNNPFIAHPLQARMLAEVFLENKGKDWQGCKEYLRGDKEEPNLPEKINMVELYDMFVEKKKGVFMDKGNPTGNPLVNQALLDQFEECLIYHRSLALEVIFTERECNLFSWYRSDSRQKETQILKMGIVQKWDDKFNFVHRTFAEYFAAEGVIKELKLQNEDVRFQKLLIDEIFFNTEYNILRHFLDNFLRNIESSVLCYSFKSYKSLVVKTNRVNLVHRLAREGHSEIIRFILKCVDFKIVRGTALHISAYSKLRFKKKNTLNILEYLVHRAGVNLKDDQERTPLHRAILGRHFDTVRLLVEMGADVKSNTGIEESVLQLALKLDRLDIIEYLVENGADVNTADERGCTALHIATKEGKSYLVKSLVMRRANVNAQDREERTPLHLAAKGRCVEIVGYLLNHGASLDISDREGRNALHLVVQNGNLEIAEFLLDSGSNINAVDKRGRTALHLASLKGLTDALEVVENLVKRGAVLDLEDDENRTAIHLASKTGNWDILKTLLASGANVCVQDKWGLTALHLATKYSVDFVEVSRKSDNRRVEAIECLLDSADVNATDREGSTALHVAVLNNDFDVAFLLVAHGADVNMADRRGRTVLHSAVENCHQDMVKFLLNNNADSNYSDEDGYTPMHLVAARDRSDLVELFVDQDLSLDITSKEGYTALHLAAKGGRWYIVKLLVEFNADLEVRNPKGRTALHFAAQGGTADICKFLLEHGMDVNDTDLKGRTPLHLAAKRGRFEVVKFLASYGESVHLEDRRGLKAKHLAKLRRRRSISEFLDRLDSEDSTSLSGIVEEWSSSEEEMEFEQ